MKIVEGYQNYRVTKDGRIFSVDRTENSKGGSKRKRKGIEMKQREGNCGYMRVGLRDGVNQKEILVHRIVAKAFVPGFMEGLVVNHIDGNKKNNNADNLEWVTRSENNIHAFSIGASKAKRGRESSSYRGDIVAVNIHTGESIVIRGKAEIIESGFTPQSVYSCINGKLSTHCGHRFSRISQPGKSPASASNNHR